jgi:hypothetical protein
MNGIKVPINVKIAGRLSGPAPGKEMATEHVAPECMEIDWQ